MDENSASSYYKSAYVKPLAGPKEHIIYRVLVNNTTTARIYLFDNCTMVQISVAGGQIRVRYIVSDEWGEKEGSESGIFDPAPAPFQSQSLGVGGNGKAYLYFAGDEIENPEWVDDPDKKYQTVGFILWFRYQGETEARSISLPALIQYLQ